MSNIAGRPTMSTNTSDEVGGSAAETFAIGFAIGGTLLLAGVILILALQARRKSFKAFFRRKKTSIQRPLVSTKSSTTNTNGHIPLETVPPPSTSR